MVIQNLQYTPLYNTLIKNKDDFEVMMEEMNKLTVQDSGSEMNTGRGKRRRTLKKRTLKKRTLKRMTKRRRY
jgi:hypothetical protein